MVRRQSSTAKTRSPSKLIPTKPSSFTASALSHIPMDHLDDETKLAKRHLTKEMWQLVSIAVKRMADELISMYNSQQTATTGTMNTELVPAITSTVSPIVPLDMTPTTMPLTLESIIPKVANVGLGAGDGILSRTSQHTIQPSAHLLQVTSDKLRKKSSSHKCGRITKSKGPTSSQQRKKKQKSFMPRSRNNSQQKLKKKLDG